MLRTVGCWILLGFSCVAVALADIVPARDVTPNKGIVNSHFSEAFAFDEDALLVPNGRGGFRRSDNSGRPWRRGNNGYSLADGVHLAAYGLCQAPSAPLTVYSPSTDIDHSRTSVFRSDDLGRKWRMTDTIAFDGLVTDCSVDASDPLGVYVLIESVLFKSTDGGSSFSQAGNGLEEENLLWQVRASRTRPATVYVVGSTESVVEDPENPDELIFETVYTIYESTDGGESFTALASIPSLELRLWPHPSVDGLLFVSTLSDDGEQQLQRSTDGGITFTAVGQARVVAFAREDPAAVYSAIVHDIHKSTDFGASFTRLAGPTPDQLGARGIDLIGVTSSEGGSRVYVSTARGVYRSDDGGTSFTSINETFRGAVVNDLAFDADGRLMVAAFSTLNVFRARSPGQPQARSYRDFGKNVPGTWGSGLSVAPSPEDSRAAVVAAVDGVFRTGDGGASWTQSVWLHDFDDPPVEEPLFSFSVRPRARFAPSNPGRVYLFDSSYRLLRSDDSGMSFRLVSEPRVTGFKLDLAVDPSHEDVLYLAGGRAGLYKSVDAGATVSNLGVAGGFGTLAIDRHDPRTIYAGSLEGGVWRSVDAGVTWLDASCGLPPGEILAVASDPSVAGRVYAWVQAAGLFVSSDRGDRWVAADTGKALRRATAFGRATMAVDPHVPGRVYLGNSGVLQIDTLTAPPPLSPGSVRQVYQRSREDGPGG